MLKRLGDPDEARPVFGVWRMAGALALAAFLGGAVGLAWQNFGTSEQEPEPLQELVEEDEQTI